MSNSDTIIIGAAPAEDKADQVILVGGQSFDLSHVFGAIADVGKAERIATQNPYSMEPLRLIAKAQKVLVGALHRPLPHQIVPILRPLIHHAAGPMADAARNAIKLRMHASNRLMQHPTQSIPLTLDRGTYTPGATTTAVLQNPYLGSGGMVHNINALWAVTAFESGALALTGGQLVTLARMAGHDYVGASTGGIQSSTGLSTTPGWGWFMWASDKRERAHTTFSPWNLQGASGILGAIMRETGTITLNFLNGAAAAFGGVFHVHVKASLCGSPFSPKDLAEIYVPWNKQLAASHHLARHWPSYMEKAFEHLGHQVRTVQGMDADLEHVLGEELYFPT